MTEVAALTGELACCNGTNMVFFSVYLLIYPKNNNKNLVLA